MFNSHSFFLHLYIFLANWYFSLLKMCFFPHNLHTYMKWLRVRQFAKLYGEEGMLTFLLFSFTKMRASFFLKSATKMAMKAKSYSALSNQ